ncbi:MAG: hypothetical protein IID39_09705, partial [Planctomycetes bacterium]|nr:hypothetical protein [Planctomycetota bacterium]
VQKLLELVPPFVVGSTVVLSDGTHAVVTQNHPEAPCRPAVRLLSGPIDSPRVQVRSKCLDLRMTRSLSIASTDGFDVRPFIFAGELEPV